MILLEKAKENFEIAEKSAEQKYYDTAVSRLYYSSYQRIINYINCNGAKEDFENFKKSPSNNNKGSHEITIDFFDNLLKFLPRERSIIGLLKSLKEARHVADYEEKRNSRKKYERYKNNTQIINNFIDNL
jgi:hypothetical protein